MSGGSGGGCPMWVLTYADMITVLMGFFVILSTMNKPEEKEKVAAELVEQFGSAQAVERFSEASGARTSKNKPTKGSAGSDGKVKTLRDGDRTTVGGPVFFESNGAELSPKSRRALLQIADSLRGKGHIIEVKAYRKQFEQDAHEESRQAVRIAMDRAFTVANVLSSEGKIREDLIRIEVAAPVEANRVSNSSAEESIPNRVDVMLLEASKVDYDKSNRRRGW
jgi:flagellar motor protein MotB